ncbi:hypothetical protein FIM08_02515 [SAR202 cluster bacterium AC-647-N09_OGT_505m]|nr:hypothetical protein [SAR202 cluster bacterium AC-647-N09_OGT_505m]
MIGWFNIHSYFLMALAISGLALILALAINNGWLRGLIMGSVVVILMAGFLMLRTGTSTHTTQGQITLALDGDIPVLLEFYSDY